MDGVRRLMVSGLACVGLGLLSGCDGGGGGDTTPPDSPVVTSLTDGGGTNDPTPEIAGTAEPGCTVDILCDGVPLGTTTADAGGYWTFTPADPIPDGEHCFHVGATDAAGNTGNVIAVTVTVDTVPPGAPVIVSPPDGMVSDGMTPIGEVSGTTEPDSTVEVFDGGSSLGTTAADAVGDWVFSLAVPLADGVHVLGAATTDVWGNTSPESASVTVTVQAPPAAPVITSPADGALLNDATPEFTGTAEPNCTVEVFDGGTLLDVAASADANGDWSLTSANPLSEGPHTLTAVAYARNYSSPDSTPVAVTIDSTPPAAPEITSPATGTVTADLTPDVSGTAEQDSTVEVFSDVDGSLGTATADGVTGDWAVTCPALAEGAHALTATATDAAGNTGPESAAVTLIVDLAPPEAPAITSPADGSLTNDPTPEIAGTAEPGSTVEVFDGGGSLGTTTADAGGGWTFTPAVPLAEGGHVLTATATDIAGKTSPESAAVTVTVDSTLPDPPVITSPADGAETSDTTPDVSGTALPDCVVTLLEGATTLGATVADGTGAWTITSSALAEGVHTLTATTTDGGETSPPSSPVTLTVDVTPPNAPAITSPTDGTVTNDATLDISGTAEADSTVEVFSDVAGSLGTATAAGGNWTVTGVTLIEGAHALTARATDTAGNTGPESAAVTLIVDLAPPEAPVITSPADGAATNDTTPDVSGTAEADSTVEVFSDVAGSLGTATATGGNWALTAGVVLGEGDHVLTARATDGVGNTGPDSAAVALAIDLTPPAAPSITSPGAGASVGPTPVVAGTAEPGSTVTLLEGATVLGTTTADGSGNWTITSSALSDGGHTLMAQATDPAGNVGPDCAPVTVTVDATPPPAPAITSPTDGTATGNPTLDISGTAEADSAVEVVSNIDGSLGTTTATGGNWTLPGVTLSQGAHTLAARATDVVGNASVVTTLTITIDTTPPGAPAITSPADGAATNDTTPDVSGTAEVDSTVEVFSDVAGSLGTATADGVTGDWAVTCSALAEGAHVLTARATDGVGNTGPDSAAVALTVDLTPPPAPSITSPGSGEYVGATPTISGTAEADSTVEVVSDVAGSLGTATATGGNWTLTSGVVLGEGDHVLAARATDPAGNPGADSASVTVTADTTPPGTPPLISAASQAGGQVECSWGAATDALSGLASYVLQVSTASDFSFDVFFDQDVGNVLTHTVDASARDTQTVYARVAAVDVAGNRGAFRALVAGVRVDATAPWVSWSTPSGSGVGLAEPIIVQFIEMMDTVSVEAAFSMAPAPTGYVFQWNAGNDQLTVIPDEPPAGLGNEDVLQDSTSYSYVVASTATDLVGNALQAMTARTFSTRDATPPALVSALCTPDGGVTYYDLLATLGPEAALEEMDTIVFAFDEDMSTGEARVEIDGAGVEIWADLFDGDGAILAWTDVRTLTLTLQTPLHAGCEYKVEIWMISDASWNWPGDVEFMLQVAQNPSVDTVPPSVIATFPRDGCLDAGLLSLVAAFISEPIAENTLSGITVTGGGLSAADFEIDVRRADMGQTMVLLEPGQSLPESTLVSVTLPATIKDLAGNALGAAFTFSFTTGSATDTGAPTISMTQPADGSADAAQLGEIRIIFEDAGTQLPEALDGSTVSAADFRIFNDTDGVLMRGWALECESGSPEVELSRLSGSVGLERGKSYTVTVGPAISDRSGNAMVASESFTFTLAAFAANAAPCVWDLEFEGMSASTSPFVRQLGYELEIVDEYMGTVTVTIVDSRGAGTGVDITEVVAIDEDWGGGRGAGELRSGGGGPPEAMTPGMTDANYPTSAYYDFDITLDDGAGGVSAYTKRAWVWARTDVPNLASVDGVAVDPVSAINVASNVPTLAWTNVDSVNADVLNLYLLDAGEMNSGPSSGLNVMLSPDVTSFDVPADLSLPAGVYLWAVTQMNMGTGFGLRMGEGWSFDFGALQGGDMTSFFTVGPDNGLLDTAEFGVAQISVAVDSDTGDFVGASDYAGTYAFASPNAVTTSYVDIAGNPGGGPELYALDDPELVITQGGPTSPGHGSLGRLGNLIMQTQASDWFAPYLTVGAKRFAVAGFDINSLDGAWCFALLSISTTGGAFDRAGASMGTFAFSGGTATLTPTYYEDGPTSDPSFDVPYTVDPDGLVHLTFDDNGTPADPTDDSVCRGYTGGDGLGSEMLVMATDNDPDSPWFLLMAKNYDLQATDELTGQYRMAMFMVRMMDGNFDHSGRGWGTIEFAAGGTYTGTVCVGDSSRGGGGQELEVSGTWVLDAGADEISLTGMGGESRFRVGPDLDTMFGFNIYPGGGSGADIVILSK